MDNPIFSIILPTFNRAKMLTMAIKSVVNQIYGDFSGYSDIAIGTARLFGFHLMQNFAFPYFSRDIAEFWRRWHISLSTWFRDYLYIPLGGSRGVIWIQVRNIFIIFVVSGFWHGANWTFIAWGALNAIYFLPLLLLKKNRSNLGTIAENKYLPTIGELFEMFTTFGLTILAWVFFRAENISQAIAYISGIFSSSIFSIPNIIEQGTNLSIFPKTIVLLLILFLLIEWIGRDNQYAIEKLGFKWKVPFRFAFYYTIIFAIFWYSGKSQQFIYFQF